MKSFRTCFSGLVKMLRPIRWKVLLDMFLGIVLVAASLGFVWTSKRVIDAATGRSDVPIEQAALLMGLVMIVQIIFRIAQRYWEGYIVVNTQNKVRADIFERVMRSTWDGRERFHSADTINRLEGDISTCVDFLCTSLPQCVVTLVQLCASATFLFMLSAKLAWILIFIMPVAVIGSRLFFKKMRRLSGEIRAGDSAVQGVMQESLQHRVLVRTMGHTAKVLEKLGMLQKDVQDKTISRLNYAAIARGFMQVGFAAGYAVAFFWGAFGIKEGTVTYGLMTAFLQLVGQVQRPVADIAQHIPAFIRALASEERLIEIQEQPKEKEHGDVRLEGVAGIRLENVTYSYPGFEEKVLDGFSFDFKPGTMTAIIGSTGAGKSTLIRVILSLLSPDSGKVFLYTGDGKTYEGCPDLRCNFMYVPQGNTLMSGSIRENLRVALADASETQMKEALHLAAADFVFDLPRGLDTVCAEIGAGLSEGQAQRIAIARALLRPGSILILDEATSALDADTELELLERLNRHFAGRKTILCITHRPAATSYADSVLKL